MIFFYALENDLTLNLPSNKNCIDNDDIQQFYSQTS